MTCFDLLGRLSSSTFFKDPRRLLHWNNFLAPFFLFLTKLLKTSVASFIIVRKVTFIRKGSLASQANFISICKTFFAKGAVRDQWSLHPTKVAGFVFVFFHKWIGFRIRWVDFVWWWWHASWHIDYYLFAHKENHTSLRNDLDKIGLKSNEFPRGSTNRAVVRAKIATIWFRQFWPCQEQPIWSIKI